MFSRRQSRHRQPHERGSPSADESLEYDCTYLQEIHSTNVIQIRQFTPDSGSMYDIYVPRSRYADLYLMHEGDLGDAGHHPSAFCDYPTTPECRRKVFQSCLDWMANGKTRACGVANWELDWLQV